MASDDNDHNKPGTASPAKIRKAACGIRFEEDELQEGIDFSAAAHLKPDDEDFETKPATPPASRNSATDKDR